MDKTIEICLNVTDLFESGDRDLVRVRFDNLTGNFDGQGLSIGCLQWNVGTGSIISLLKKILTYMPIAQANAYFSMPNVITTLCQGSKTEAMELVLSMQTEKKNRVDSRYAGEWKSFLNTDASKQAQLDLVRGDQFARACDLALKFAPQYKDNLRVLAFFFDLVTQSGSMQNSRGSVKPVSVEFAKQQIDTIISYASKRDKITASLWLDATKGKGDDLAYLLLYYAYARSLLSKAEFVWDAMSRRGSIACRLGIVHKSHVDFRQLLP